MTKADIISKISKQTRHDKEEVSTVLESFLDVVKNSMTEGNDIFMRGFGTFLNKKKAKKIGRIVLANTPIVIPEHYVPRFKPCAKFKQLIIASKKVKLQKNTL